MGGGMPTANWRTTTTFLHDLRTQVMGQTAVRDAAWQRFEARFRKPIVAFAARRGLSPFEAEDVAQETVAKFIEKHRAREFDHEKGRLSAYLFGIARLMVLKQRTGKRERQVAAEEGQLDALSQLADPGESPEEAWEEEWQQALFSEALEQARIEFETKSYGAFVLTALEGLSADETAQRLDVKKKAVFDAKHRVLKRIRELCRQFEEE